MARYSQHTDGIRRVVLQPAIVRAFWSHERAWQGAQVKLHVETRYVPDGTQFKLQIWESDAGEGSPDDFVIELDEGYEINNNRCVVEHTLRWDPDTLGDPLELEGDSLEFYFVVLIEDLSLRGQSNLLYVDLHGFGLSG